MPRPLPPGTWFKASDEADGNAGRPQPGFFRITVRQKIFRTLPHGRSLVFSGSQAKIFRTLPITDKKYFVLYPQMAWGGEFFSSDIMWWLGDWTRLILHQLPLPRSVIPLTLERSKDRLSLVYPP